MTIIWSDWKDNDTQQLQEMWSGINNVNLMHLKYWNNVVEKAVDLAIANETSTLLFCGHGTSYGLLAPKNYVTYVLHQMNAGLIKAQKVIGVSCHCADFAERTGLHGLFTSMFISNIGEAIDYNVQTDNKEIEYANGLIFKEINNILKNNMSLNEGCDLLHSLTDTYDSDLMRFNIDGIKIL